MWGNDVHVDFPSLCVCQRLRRGWRRRTRWTRGEGKWSSLGGLRECSWGEQEQLSRWMRMRALCPGVFWTSGERCCSSGWPGSSASVAYGRSLKDVLHQPINKYKSQSEPKLTNYNQGLLVITACNIITGLSALSMSAISTNGQIAAGGVYYMISRFAR